MVDYEIHIYAEPQACLDRIGNSVSHSSSIRAAAFSCAAASS